MTLNSSSMPESESHDVRVRKGFTIGTSRVLLTDVDFGALIRQVRHVQE
jgi:hypothetical protein